MALLNFLVASSSSLQGVKGQEPNMTIYAEDLGLGQSCMESVGSAWPCLSCEQQVFQNDNLTNPVVDGYYLVKFESGLEGIWYIVGGFPQGSGFTCEGKE